MANKQFDQNRSLSKINLLEIEFIVDFDLSEIRQLSKSSNTFSFTDLKFDNNLDGYPIAFDPETKKIHKLDDPSIASKYTEQLLIPDLLVLGRTDIVHNATALNGKNPTKEENKTGIENKHGFAKVTLANTEFLVDGPSRVLRQVADGTNIIPFEKLKYDSAKEGYPILFDRLNKNIYRGYLPKAGLPPMTERIVIPRMNAIENFRIIKPDKVNKPEGQVQLMQRKSNGRKKSR